MRTHTLWAAVAAALLLPSAHAAEFAYRGTLEDAGRPAEGLYDLQVSVYGSERGGVPVAAPIVLPGVRVSAGRFAVPIAIDDAVLRGDATWLELAVREAGSKAPFDVLPAREKAVAGPTAVCTGAWDLSGNSGIPAGSYLGNSDARVLELRTNNVAVARFDPRSAQADIGSIAIGASTSRATSDASVVLGGYLHQGNTASGFASLSAGGFLNAATGSISLVAGGQQNTASGRGASALGGVVNSAGGDTSVAMGRFAAVRDRVATGETGDACAAGGVNTCGDEGTFVWADAVGGTFASTGPNQFLVRAAGGVGINTAAPPAGQLAVAGDVQLTRTAAREIYVGEEPDNNTAGKNLTVSAGDASSSGIPFQARVGGDLVLQAGNGYNASVAGADGGDVLIRSGANWITGNSLEFSGGDIVLQTGGHSNAFTERVRVKDTGEVSVAVLGAAGATTLCRNASNQIATCSSSARYKDRIVDADYGIDTVAALRPVRFEWKDTQEPDLGLVAEEVAEVEPALATRNADGEVEGVKYDRLAAVLVKAMQEQQAQLAQHRAQIDALRQEQQRLVALLQQLGAAGGDPIAMPAPERAGDRGTGTAAGGTP